MDEIIQEIEAYLKQMEGGKPTMCKGLLAQALQAMKQNQTDWMTALPPLPGRYK